MMDEGYIVDHGFVLVRLKSFVIDGPILDPIDHTTFKSTAFVLGRLLVLVASFKVGQLLSLLYINDPPVILLSFLQMT